MSTSTSNMTQSKQPTDLIDPYSGITYQDLEEAYSKYIVGTETEEVRVTDPSSGGQKGKKLEAFDLVPTHAMEEVARVYGRGAEKYEERNWEKGYDWGLSLAALERHLNKFKAGEQRDELGNHHLACVVFHALALITFEKFGLGKDTRSKLGQRAKGTPPAPAGYQIPGTRAFREYMAVDGSGVLAHFAECSQGLASFETPTGDTICGCGVVLWKEQK